MTTGEPGRARAGPTRLCQLCPIGHGAREGGRCDRSRVKADGAADGHLCAAPTPPGGPQPIRRRAALLREAQRALCHLARSRAVDCGLASLPANKQMTVSIIIPAYNAERYLAYT